MRKQFEHRTQILLDRGRLERLRSQARRRGCSVGEVIRDAIDTALPAEETDRVDPTRLKQRRKAIDELLALPPMPVPESLSEMKQMIEESHIDPEFLRE